MSILLRKPYILATIIAIALFVWLASGQQDSKKIIPQKITTAKTSLMQVQIRQQVAESLIKKIILTGHTAPLRTTILRSEIEAKVIKIGAKRGSKVNKGDLIVQLAINDKAIYLQETKALVKQREFEYKAKQKLLKQGYQSKIQIATASTLLENAKTLAKQAQIALANTKIMAPFAGILESRQVELGDYVGIGAIIAEIIDEDPFLVIGEITELQRKYLYINQKAEINLITGETINGKIVLISSRANSATRTFNIEIQVSNLQGKLVAGITSEIHIGIRELLAHKVSASLLSLNDEGILGIKAVESDNKVIFYPANFARATSENLWLTDLPKQLSLITVGQGFVRPGDFVKPVLEVEK